jgi:coenzyme F420-reducing hydrogenase alpha subunit
MFKDRLDGLSEEVENFDNFPSYYMGLVTASGGLEMYDGNIRVVDQDGKIIDQKSR